MAFTGLIVVFFLFNVSGYSLPLGMATSNLKNATSSDSSSGGKDILYFGACLGSVFAGLLVFKQIYMKNRRVKINHSKRFHSLNSPGLQARCSERIGVFVGLFGSPTWETSITNKYNTSSLTTPYPYHFCTQTCSQVSSRGIDSVTIGKQSVSKESKVCSSSVESTRQSTSALYDLPIQPSNVYLGFARPQATRFSLPNLGHKGTGNSLRNMKTSSLGSDSTQLMPSSETSISLRLITSATGRTRSLLPLPLDQDRVQPLLDLASFDPLICYPDLPTNQSMEENVHRDSSNNSWLPSGSRGQSVLGLSRVPLSSGVPPVVNSSPILDFEQPFNPLKVRPKARSPSQRKRSLTLGPSPLRSMIFPEPSYAHTARNAIGFEDAQVSILRRMPSCHQYKTLGIGFPPCRHHVLPSHDPHNAEVKGPYPRSNDSEDMLAMISELVEETRDWDPSLFVDENFKAMIARSKR